MELHGVTEGLQSMWYIQLKGPYIGTVCSYVGVLFGAMGQHPSRPPADSLQRSGGA